MREHEVIENQLRTITAPVDEEKMLDVFSFLFATSTELDLMWGGSSLSLPVNPLWSGSVDILQFNRRSMLLLTQKDLLGITSEFIRKSYLILLEVPSSRMDGIPAGNRIDASRKLTQIFVIYTKVSWWRKFRTFDLSYMSCPLSSPTYPH